MTSNKHYPVMPEIEFIEDEIEKVKEMLEI